MSDHGSGRYPRPTRIAALISPVLISIIVLNLLVCTAAQAVALPAHTISITLPGYGGKCPELYAGVNNIPCVKALQNLLNKLNFTPRLTVDGSFGTYTKRNVIEFQQSRKLSSQKGVVEQETASALETAWKTLQAECKDGKAAAPTRTSAAGRASSTPAATADGSPSTAIISLSDIVAIGIFAILALAIVIFGRRLSEFTVSFWGKVVITVRLVPTREQMQLELQRLLVELARVCYADKVVDTFRQMAGFIVKETKAVDERPRRNILSRPLKMIQGRVEKD
jgi:peptidoglycan hydrolase-like protein with peptidoglycan-binding domain